MAIRIRESFIDWGRVLKYEKKFNIILFIGLLQELVVILDTDKESKSKQETMMKKHTAY